ncbi:MAG: alpha/beta fold hydrolase [Chitinophagales bacterium]|nr:alpha/beta fold hydrolase [Chitinophagales bacterium]
MKTSHILIGSCQRKFLADTYTPPSTPKGIVIFSHGFKGFKDWGAFPLMAAAFAQYNFACITFNFSHNGTTVEQPDSFADIEAFGNNNISKEVDDLGVVIEFAMQYFNLIQTSIPIYLLGHSRGGGISILKAAEDHNIAKVAVWGSVSEFGNFWKTVEMEKMKREGVIYIPNNRTKQQLPIYWQLYQDYETNIERLHIPSRVKCLQIPLLIVHGTQDETVPFSAAQDLKKHQPNAQLVAIENGNHTFGASHPWLPTSLPLFTDLALQSTIAFFNS